MRHPRRSFLQFPLLAAEPVQAGERPRSRTLEGRLLSALDAVDLVDTHEHLLPERERVSQEIDFFTLAGHYAISDVVSAGLPPESLRIVNNCEAPLAERWRAFEPFWKSARFTGYGQALRIAIADIYGVKAISGSTIPRINEAIRAQNKLGFYRHVLKQRARIRFAVLDDYWNATPVRPDPEFFVLARKFDRFITPSAAGAVRQLEQITGVSITTVAGLKQAMERSFEQSLEAGMVTVKTTLAYSRRLRFDEATEADAARDFERLMRASERLPERHRQYEIRVFRGLEDHMFHHLVGLADARRVPVQVHTGLQAGNGNLLGNSNPLHLTNLFFLYPWVKFDLFHIGYPFLGEVGVLAKTFPNVYADFCWAHIISPTASRRALHEFLETIPLNKIFGFGGDYRYPELSYAHAKMARRNIAQVLAEKTEAGFCTEEEAVEIGAMLLRDNPLQLFGPKPKP